MGVCAAAAAAAAAYDFAVVLSTAAYDTANGALPTTASKSSGIWVFISCFSTTATALNTFCNHANWASPFKGERSSYSSTATAVGIIILFLVLAHPLAMRYGRTLIEIRSQIASPIAPPHLPPRWHQTSSQELCDLCGDSFTLSLGLLMIGSSLRYPLLELVRILLHRLQKRHRTLYCFNPSLRLRFHHQWFSPRIRMML